DARPLGWWWWSRWAAGRSGGSTRAARGWWPAAPPTSPPGQGRRSGSRWRPTVSSSLNPRRGAASVDVLTVDAAIAHHRTRSKLSIMVLTASSNRLEALRYLMREFESSSRRSSQGRSSAWGVGLPSRVSMDIEASVDWARQNLSHRTDYPLMYSAGGPRHPAD